MDNKPLVLLYNKPNRLAPARVDRHRSKLMAFNFTVKYEPGLTSPCDYASRHTPPIKTYSKEEKERYGIEEEEEDGEIWINGMIDQNTPIVVTME